MSDHTTEISAEDFASLLAEIDAARDRRATLMPDVRTALRAMFEAFDRLRELGWREGIYAPKDGTEFEVIEAGSTGVFHCRYYGSWPDGMWMTSDGHDLYPSQSPPMLFRLSEADEAARKARMAAAAERFARERSDD